MKVLIADDSVVFRSQIKLALSDVVGVEVVGTASNGKIVLDKLVQSDIDLIIMDLEMPEMNGLDALKEMRRRGHLTKVVMFSSHTKSGAEATMEALRAGAQDFATKPSGEGVNIENAALFIKKALIPKIEQFISVKVQKTPETEVKRVESVSATPRYGVYPLSQSSPDVFVIGSSTGGPAALDEVLRGLEGKRLRCPILIAQHMPPVFTASLASRIQKLTGIECSEGKHMDLLEKKIYVAPGDYHMTVGLVENRFRILLDQGPQRNSVRPAVDNLFESVSPLFGKKCVGAILTGMGCDGAVGAVAIKNGGGGIIVQNKESCVVFGMPAAVCEVGAFDQVANLDSIRDLIVRLTAA